MEQAYQFLQKGSEHQYEILIRNYLSLGQFELARASIGEYHTIAPTQCLALLKSFITSDPQAQWLLPKSVPSTSHLIWLCLVEYKNLLPNNFELDLPKAFTEQLEFDVLLEAALDSNDTDDSESFTENVIHELRTSGEGTESGTQSLSSGTLSRLRNVATLRPGLGTSLTRALAPRASRALVELSAQLIADLLSAQHREEALQFVKLLNAAQRNDSAALDADELVTLFKQLIALYGNEQETGPWRQRLYSALLSHCSDNENRLVAQFARVEDELLSRAHKDAPLNVAFDHVRALVKNDLNGQARDPAQEEQQLGRFWRDFYHVMRVTNQHGLEFVLTRAVECVNSGQFEECAVVLRPFERLKPLVLLMVWDKFENDVDARIRLMNILWHQGGKQEAKDKDVALKCDILDYSIRVSQWTAEQLLKDNETEIKVGNQRITKKGNQSLQQFTTAITNALHNELKVHSIAFALQSVCCRLEDRQVLELLAANPDHSEISVNEQTQDLVLLNTYFVVKSVMVMFDHVVKSANVDQTLLEQQCHVAADYIAKISDKSTLAGLAETLLAFVFLKRSAWQQVDAKQRDLFVATPSLVKLLLDMANQCLTHVEISHDTSIEFKYKLEALQQFWREFKWRYDLIANLRLTVGVDVSKYYGTEAKNRHFVNLMLASPTTLLIMCVREKDFTKCKSVIKFFDLTARDTELARLAEEFNNIITKIGDNVSKDTVGELLSRDLSPNDAFNVCADFALTRAQTREQSELFLDHASQLLQQQIKQHGGDVGKKNSKKGNVPSHLTNFENYLSRLKLLQSSQLDYPQRLSSRLLSTEFFPVDAKALKAFLGNRMALRAAVSALYAAIKDPQQRTTLDSLLRRVNMQLSGGGTHDASDKTKSHAYVHRIVRHLLLVGDALASDKYFGSKDYATHLKRTPAQILAELVFKSRNYEQAEDLATELGLELTAVILSHLEADRTGVNEKKNSSSALNKSLPRQSSLPGLLKSPSPSVTVIGTPSRQLNASGSLATSYSTSLKSPSPSPSFLSSSFSARDSYFDDLDRGDEHGAVESKSFDQGTSPHDAASRDQATNQSGKYHLDIEVINYIAKQSPLLASLASLLRSPTSRFDPEFLETALSRSRRYPSLFNWICSRARTYGVFRAVFLQPHPSFDGLARQLDPNNYAFLNLENTKKGKKKRQSSSRQNQDDGSELSRSVKSSAAEEFDDMPSPSPSPSHMSKSLKVDAFRGQGHRRMKSSGEQFEGDWPPSLGSVGPGERFLTFESVNYIRAKDQKFLDTIFSEDDIRQEQEFYSTLLDKMVLAGAHEEAIRLADVTMPLGAPDFLLRLVVERAEDKTRVTEYLLRMQDKKQSATLVLQHLNAWPLDVALDLLYMCKCHLNMTPGDPLIERLELHHNKLQLFKDILNDPNNVDKWKRWQQLEQWCLKDPVSVIKHLLLSSHFDLAARVAAQFRVTSMKKEIEEQSLLHLLNDTHDIAQVRQRLAAMGPESIAVAESLLDHVKQPETIMFLIQYLMEYKSALAAALNNSNAPINDKELGIKVLVLLPPAQQKVFKGLLNQPLLVVESLLMSEQTSTLVPVFKEIPQIRNDELIVSYAHKALELPQDRAGPSEYRQWVLDETNAESLRKKHSYPSAPNHVLATAILDLCYDAKRVAKWCVDGAAKLSTFAFGTSSNQASNEVTNQLTQSGSMTPVKGDTSQWTKAEAMSAVSHLLYYAKVRLSRESESLSGDSQVISMTEMIDITLSRLDLLRRLILLTGIDRAREDKNGLRHKLPFNLDLNALNDAVKARQLRDELIDEDRMDEAIEVANKCNVEREPVWAAWGLSLLKMGKYEQAKEKFKYSLTPQEPRRATGAPPVNRTLLTRIINVLESDAPLDAFNLRQKYEELSQRLANKAGTKKAAKTFDDTMSFESYLHVLQVSPQKKKVEPASNAARNPVAVVKRQLNLDSVRYMQCIYYLQNYGTPNDLLAFWLRHQLLEDACRYVLSYCHQLANQAAAADQSAINSTAGATNAGNQLFIDLVLYILAHNKLKEFKEILLKIDPQLGKWRECLLATCRYFNVRKESVLLLEFQVLMRDFIRAGLTCIKLFERNEDLTDKINYLNLAKQHLQQGLEEYQTEVNKQGGTVSINSNILGTKSISDIHRYVKTINLQLEVTKFMQQLLAKNKGAKSTPSTNNNTIVEPEQSEQSEEDGHTSKKKKQKNSLFGTTQAKSIIAERMLVEHNFDLGFKIVQEFHLPMARIYNNALLKLAQSKQTKFVNELLKSIKPFLNDDEWDPILSAIVQVYVEQNQDPNTAEKFATNIKSEESKAMALLLCGKLKSAYLSAIKTSNLNTVLAIRDEAKKRGAKRELELCEKFIASKTSQGASVTNNNTSISGGNNNNK